MKYFSCRDAGVNCNWETQGETDQEIISKAFEHAKKFHDFKELTDELRDKIRSVIRDRKAA